MRQSWKGCDPAGLVPGLLSIESAIKAKDSRAIKVIAMLGWSLSEVDPLQFPNKGIPSAMAIHPVWLPFASLGFQEEGLDLVASAPWKEGCGTPVQGKGLDLGPPQCQAFPQPHPPIWQAPSGWQSRACFPGRPFLGVPGEMGEGRGFPWAVCLPPRPLSFRVSISLRNTVAAHGTVFCAG